MKSRFLIFSGLLVLLLSSLIFPQMCDSGTTDPENTENPFDLTGSWNLSATIISNTFGLPNGETTSEIIYLSDSSGVLLITNFDGLWGFGEVDGLNIHFTGTEMSDDFGRPATLVTEGTGSVTETRINGSFTTTVYFDQGNIGQQGDGTITFDYEMIKLEESPCLDRAIFGNPEDSDYILPYPVGSAYPVYQSYCWRTGGHRNQLAYDFTIPIGDTVVAARGGIVREVREDSPDNGQGLGEHNYVYIEHEDGTCASYAHLMQNCVNVTPGDTVSQGQFFALSGNSGESGEPHLHFGVYEDYPVVEGIDIPINFRNAQGPLDSRGGLIRGEIYRALHY